MGGMYRFSVRGGVVAKLMCSRVHGASRPVIGELTALNRQRFVDVRCIAAPFGVDAGLSLWLDRERAARPPEITLQVCQELLRLPDLGRGGPGCVPRPDGPAGS